MSDDSVEPLIQPIINRAPITPEATFSSSNHQMEDLRRASGGGASGKKGKTWVLILSYVIDWIILVIAAGIGYVMGDVTPNKRPFSITDPDISFPFTEHETVPAWLAFVVNTFAPAVIVVIICLIFVPGSTVPRGTPKTLIWKRKLWELHTGLLGLALSVVAAWLITNGMKNMFGKPRPDLLDRCQPDLANINRYIIGGFANPSNNGQLVSADICKNTDKAILDDGFRSYPSGHSSSSAAGLIYLSLFIASKFVIVIPYYSPGYTDPSAAFAAFPSRMRNGTKSTDESYELHNRGPSSSPVDPSLHKQTARQRRSMGATRRQAAAPPLYLLLIAILPFFAAVFIASSRWFDFRHHGFDILFGFFIGTVTAFFAFYYYHLPISQGAGWAWGPRSVDKAFWAGVGSYSYATNHVQSTYRHGDEEEALEDVNYAYPRSTDPATGLDNRTPPSARKATTQDASVMDTEYRGHSAGLRAE